MLIKFTLILSALGLMLTACGKTMSDDSIHRQVIGAWKLESRPGKVIENQPDGVIVVKMNGVETARGQWQVKDGYLIEGIGSGIVESNKVLKVSEDTMVVLSVNGHTQLTFRRQ